MCLLGQTDLHTIVLYKALHKTQCDCVTGDIPMLLFDHMPKVTEY